MIYVVTINDKEYEVEVEVGKANILKTTAITVPVVEAVPVAMISHQPVPVSAAPAAVHSSGAGVVKAPMPGTILEIKVQPGTAVKKGEVLLILEAMKMENEILASSDGIVKQVVVAKSATVSTGDILVVIQ